MHTPEYVTNIITEDANFVTQGSINSLGQCQFVTLDNNDCLWQSQFGQCQIYSSERQNFTRTKPLMLTKNKSLTLFLVWRLKLLKAPMIPEVEIVALITIRSSLRWLQGRASILLQRLNQKYGVDQRRRSQFRVEEWTELSLPKSGFLYPILLEIPLINLLLVVHQYLSMMSFVGWSAGFSRNVICLLVTGFSPKRHLFFVYRFFPKTSFVCYLSFLIDCLTLCLCVTVFHAWVMPAFCLGTGSFCLCCLMLGLLFLLIASTFNMYRPLLCVCYTSPTPGLKIFRANSVFRASASCSKILNDKKCVQYREKFQGKLCFSDQAQVAQKSWTVKKFPIQCI